MSFINILLMKNSKIKEKMFCQMWEPMCPEPTGLISDIYSKFIFVK